MTAAAAWPSPSGAATIAWVVVPLSTVKVVGEPTAERMPGPAPRSAVETSALQRAGEAAQGIRSAVGDPGTFTVDKGTTTQAIVAAPEGDGQAAAAVIPG